MTDRDTQIFDLCLLNYPMLHIGNLTSLEKYLDKYENKELSSSIYSMYKEFNYIDEDLYTIDLNFMLNNIYCIKIIDEQEELRKKRMGQKEFRQKLLEQYNNRCIVTGNDCTDELEACHIVPVADKEDYSLDNGLLLAKTIHATFDKYYWSINPDTFRIEGLDKGTIKQYIDMTLPLNNDMRKYLSYHYNIFKNKK